jgi:hypothetical protein
MSTFPQSLKITTSEIPGTSLNIYEQLLVIYYNKYKNEELFSFEHLCGIINHNFIARTLLVYRMIKKYRQTNQWDIKQLGERRTRYLIQKLLNFFFDKIHL